MSNYRSRGLFSTVPRVAGQWLDRSLNDWAYACIQGYYGVILLAALAIVAWIQRWTEQTMDPVLFTELALGAACFWWVFFEFARKNARNIKLGRDGERVAAQILEKLRTLNYEVFHDFDKHYRGNIDHILVGPAGVFAIETKAKSKTDPEHKNIEFDGKRLHINGETYTKELKQTRDNAAWLANFLSRKRQQRTTAFPVLLFPARYVKSPAYTNKDEIWVLNPEQLHAWLEQSPTRLTPHDIKTIAAILTDYQKAD